MKFDSRNIINLRILSKVFSPPIFQKIVREEDFIPFEKKITKYFFENSCNSNLDIIKTLYKFLQKQYRCEYIYKNNLFINIIEEHGLKDTLTINELKVGISKADLVLLNGSIRIYEIKTELDGLSKLSKQLNDYQKFANKVYIVTDEKYAKKLMLEYCDTNIGIIVFNDKNKLETIKDSCDNSSLFEFDTIFKILRKQEYLDLVVDNFGLIPPVSNTKIFKTCYEMLSTIDIIDFQNQVLNKLKSRKLAEPELLKSSKTPIELKHICNSLDFSKQEYQKLYNFLAIKSVCTNHI